MSWFVGVGVECQVVVAALREVHVSWENYLGPSPDAGLLPGEGVLPPVGRKCCERAAGPGPGVLSTACNAGGMGA